MPDEQRKRRPLVEIAHDVLRALDQSEGEVDAALEALDLELEDKVDAYAMADRELAGIEQVNDDLAAFYKARADFTRNKRKRLRERLHYGLNIAGTTDIRTRITHVFYKVTHALQLDLEKFQSAHPFTLFPELYKTKNPEPSTSAVKALVQAGAKFSGAELVENRSLQIR